MYTNGKSLPHLIFQVASAAGAALLLSCVVATAAPVAKAVQGESKGHHAEHAVAGVIKKVDHGAKVMVVASADGVEHTVKFTEKTVVHGAKDVAKATDTGAKATLEGGAVVLYYTGEGVDKTAVRVDHLGKRTFRETKGALVRVDDAGKFIVVKTAAGAEETFDLGRHVAVDTEKGTERAGAAALKAMKSGAEVTVHYSEEGGKKVAHVVRHV
jgi:hypothetical protein